MDFISLWAEVLLIHLRLKFTALFFNLANYTLEYTGRSCINNYCKINNKGEI